MDMGFQQFKLYRVYQNRYNGPLLSEAPSNNGPLWLSGVMSQYIFEQNNDDDDDVDDDDDDDDNNNNNNNKDLVLSPRLVLYSKTDWPTDRRS
jgi:hypothetical protein